MKNIFLILIVFTALTVYGQKGIVNNGARIVVDNGAYIKVQGDNTTGYTNKSYGSKHGRIDLDGEIVVNGFFNNNATANSVFINLNGTGVVSFEGASSQAIGGINPIVFEGVNLSGGNITLNTDISLTGALNFGSGLLDLNSNMLSFGSSASVSGTPGTSSMIIPGTNGIVRKYYSSASSFTYPIGDNSGTAVYLPVVSNISTGSFGSGAYLDLQMINSKHPENSNLTDYISRYWDLSEYNISSFSAALSFTYANADIAGTESNLYALGYDGTFWNVYNTATTATNKLTANVTQFDQMTGGASEAVIPQISWSSDGEIAENLENGEEIRVDVVNDLLVGTLSAAQWNVSGLPAGVSVGSVTRPAADTAVITLSGNRLDDYDDHITISLSVNASQFVHTAAGSLSPDTDIIITANNDGELIEMADDGSIVEGSESGEIIEVTLTGGTFADPLNTGNWVGINMPTGVSLGSITRQSATLVKITLNGNATVDYDMNITNFQLTIPASDINEYGSNYVLTTGVTFKAIDESLVISMTDGGSGIDESAEDGHVIVVSIDQRVFAATLTTTDWNLFNIPGGVQVGGVERTNDTAVYITLSGDRTVDYDANITNTELTIASSQIVGISNDVTVSSGVIFNAFNDPESIVIALDGDGITEGSEDGEVIIATLTGGTFPDPLIKENWTLNNLPQGVSIGSVSRTALNKASIVLSGNREVDFDSNITSIDLDVSDTEVDDFSSTTLSSDNSVTIFTYPDNELLTLSGGPFTEGAEDGGIITATLTGGTFTTVTISDVSLNNLPVGVSLGEVTQNSNTELKLTLSGNASEDYDLNITNATLTVDASVIDETASDVSGTGVTFQAVVEPVVLVLSDNSDLYENEEDTKELVIKVREDIFASSIDPAGFTFNGLPGGVDAGSVVRTNDTTVTVTLSGNRTTDYDANIVSAGVEISNTELQNSTTSLSSYTGWTFIATDDGEYVSFSTTATINEGAEDGTDISVSISGGTFPVGLDAAEWSFTGIPGGVSVGSVSRVDELNATITLSGNASTDYDTDIDVTELVISGSQIDDYDLATITGVGSITFNAVVETQDLLLTPVIALNEANLNGAQLGLKLVGATFVSPLQLSDFSLNNYPAGLTLDAVSEISSDSAVIDLAFDGTDFDIDYPNFNVTLLAAGSSMGENVNSNGVNIDADVEPGEMIITHSGLTESNLDGAIIDITLINDAFVDGVLNTGSFALNNAPMGAVIADVTYISSTSATFEIAYDGTDFDLNITDFSLSMNASESTTGNIYESNVLTINAVNDTEVFTITDPSNVMEGFEDGQTFTVQLTGGTFTSTFNVLDWSLSYAPQGVSIGSVDYLDQNNAEVHLLGNTAEDYDVNESVAITVASSQYNDGSIDITTDNSFVFEAYVENLYTTTDTIVEADINTISIPFVIEDDWLINLTPSVSDVILQNAPPSLEIASVTAFDSANFAVEFNYSGGALSQDELFGIMLIDNALHGLQSLVSNEIFIDAEVGISGLSDGIQMYINDENLVLKQTGSLYKGIITLFETNGRKAAEFTVDAKTLNVFKPLLKENVYIIQFTTDYGKQYRIKGFLNR